MFAKERARYERDRSHDVVRRPATPVAPLLCGGDEQQVRGRGTHGMHDAATTDTCTFPSAPPTRPELLTTRYSAARTWGAARRGAGAADLAVSRLAVRGRDDNARYFGPRPAPALHRTAAAVANAPDNRGTRTTPERAHGRVRRTSLTYRATRLMRQKLDQRRRTPLDD
ncbi:hypothetical protein RR46_11719 [Papilio xuthus]|uniref:Uncharacterized protein n=1 Tax=Papilio xuthus TaxID=66420 RepID=A0A194PRC8_PAPXU|nr:hypothetical protein RR46_11719 [Papilio xuthus]